MGTIIHHKISLIPDDPAAVAAGEIVPSDWNHTHDFDLGISDIDGLQAALAAILSVSKITTNNSVLSANSGEQIYSAYNGIAAPFSVLLPPVPAANQVITIIDADGAAATYLLTVNGNGKNIWCYGSLASTAGINSAGGSIRIAWDGIQWNAIS